MKPETGIVKVLDAPDQRLTDAMIATFAELIKIGVERPIAADSIGVPRQTVRKWLADGMIIADGKDPRRKLLNAVLQAEAEAEISAIRALTNAFGTDWRAAHAYLKHHPATRDRWGSKRIIVQMPIEGAGDARAKLAKLAQKYGKNTAKK